MPTNTGQRDQPTREQRPAYRVITRKMGLAPEAANRAKPSRHDAREPLYLRKRCWASHWIEHDAAVAGRDTLAVDSRHRGVARFAYALARRSARVRACFEDGTPTPYGAEGDEDEPLAAAADRHAAIIAAYALPEGLGPGTAVTIPARPLGIGSFLVLAAPHGFAQVAIGERSRTVNAQPLISSLGKQSRARIEQGLLLVGPFREPINDQARYLSRGEAGAAPAIRAKQVRQRAGYQTSRRNRVFVMLPRLARSNSGAVVRQSAPPTQIRAVCRVRVSAPAAARVPRLEVGVDCRKRLGGAVER